MPRVIKHTLTSWTQSWPFFLLKVPAPKSARFANLDTHYL